MKSIFTGFMMMFFIWSGLFQPVSIMAGQGIAIIVNTNNNETVDLSKLERLYLKRIRFWENGKEVVPVDQISSTAVYQEFIGKVLRKSHRDITNFWIQKAITNNLKPPITLKTDEQVISFVKKAPTAIGYIDKSKVNSSVKVVLEIE